jgi:hypothetical protein
MRILIALLLALTLVGCASTRKVVETSRTDTAIKSEEVSTSKEISTTVTTEKVDTTVTIPGETTSVTRPLDELLRGDTITAESNGTSVKVVYNPKTNTVTAVGKTEERTVPVSLFKTTTTNLERDSRTDYKSDTRIREDEKAVTKEKESVFKEWAWLIILLTFLLLLIVGYGLYRWLR